MKPMFAGIVLAFALATAVQATVWQVNVADFAFTPADLTILQGDTVRWTNTSGFHNVRHRCDPSLFGNDPAAAQWTYQFVFNTGPGNYPYQCDVHPESMQGMITVARRGHWNVTVRSFSFTPQHLTILPGDTVTWTNVSGTHNVHHTGVPSLFGNTIAPAPWVYSFTFNLPDAVYSYLCEQHPSLMTGSVTVSSPPPPGSALSPDRRSRCGSGALELASGLWGLRLPCLPFTGCL